MPQSKYNIANLVRHYGTLDQTQRGHIMEYVKQKINEALKNVPNPKKNELTIKIQKEVKVILAGGDSTTTNFSTWVQSMIQVYVPKSDKRMIVRNYFLEAANKENDNTEIVKTAVEEKSIRQITIADNNAHRVAYKLKANEL